MIKWWLWAPLICLHFHKQKYIIAEEEIERMICFMFITWKINVIGMNENGYIHICRTHAIHQKVRSRKKIKQTQVNVEIQFIFNGQQEDFYIILC